MKKRLLSILVATAMILGMLPVSVFAEDEVTEPDGEPAVVSEEEDEETPEEPSETEAEAEEPGVDEAEEEPQEELPEVEIPVVNDPVVEEPSGEPENTNVVTAANFSDFFDDDGVLKATEETELVFKGDLSNIGNEIITIGRKIKITSDNAVFKNVMFIINADEVSVDGIKIVCDDKTRESYTAMLIAESSGVTVSNCTISFAKTSGCDGSCIYSTGSDKLTLTGNTFKYTGDTDGDSVNMPVRIEGGSEPADGITMTGNTIEASIPSVDVDWDNNWEAMYKSVGLVFQNCTGLDLSGNTITITSSGKAGYYPTVTGILCYAPLNDSGSEPQIKICDNTLSITGSTYVYGLETHVSSYACTGNNITVVSDIYGCAINAVASCKSETISSNNITVESDLEAYGIYAYTYSGEHEEAKINGNKIELDSNTCTCIYKNSNAGSGKNCFTVSENTLKTKGSVLTGIDLLKTGSDSVISGNEIYTEATKVKEDDPIARGIIIDNGSAKENKIMSSGLGILAKGAVTIEDNHIETAYDYTIDLGSSASIVTGNYLKAATLNGDASVKGSSEATISGNGPVNIAQAVVTGIKSKTYTGKPITQSITVKYGNTTLKSGTDYTVSYKSNTKAGNAKVTITGKGMYIGNVTKTFKIYKAKNPLMVKGKNVTAKLKKLKTNNVTLTVAKITKKGQGSLNYELSSAKKSNKSFKKYFKVNSKTGKLTVKKGTPKGTYKILIKVKAKGNKNYNASSWLKFDVTLKVK